MRRNERERTDGPRDARESFAAWFRERLTHIGYDLTGPRSGGKTKFAEDAGVSHAAVSRILGAKATPTPDLLASMAPVLRVSLGELLVRAGIATEEQIERVGNRAAVDMPLTVEQAAALLGISDPQSVAMFVTFVTGLQQQEAQRKTDTDRQGTTGTER